MTRPALVAEVDAAAHRVAVARAVVGLMRRHGVMVDRGPIARAEARHTAAVAALAQHDSRS